MEEACRPLHCVRRIRTRSMVLQSKAQTLRLLDGLDCGTWNLVQLVLLKRKASKNRQKFPRRDNEEDNKRVLIAYYSALPCFSRVSQFCRFGLRAPMGGGMARWRDGSKPEEIWEISSDFDFPREITPCHEGRGSREGRPRGRE